MALLSDGGEARRGDEGGGSAVTNDEQAERQHKDSPNENHFLLQFTILIQFGANFPVEPEVEEGRERVNTRACSEA